MADNGDKDDKTKFTSLDPETLSDELKGIYKSMQGDYTAKTQAISDMRKEFEGKETAWEEKLKTFGATENENKQWRDWYKQLEDQTKQVKPDEGLLSITSLDPNNDDPDKASVNLANMVKALDQQIKDLKGELTSVHGGLKDSRDQTNRMFSYQAQLGDLAGKYPGLNKQEVLDHALSIGQTNLEKAYRDLKQDDLIAAEVERRVKEEMDKERTVGIGAKSPGRQVIVRRNEGTPKTFADASEQILASIT